MKRQHRGMLFSAVVSMLITGAAFRANMDIKTAKAYTPESLSQEERLEKDIKFYNIENDILPPAFMSNEKMKEMGVNEGDVITIDGKGVFIVRSILSMRDDIVIIPSEDVESDVTVYEYK